jgi:hypothetical protein
MKKGDIITVWATDALFTVGIYKVDQAVVEDERTVRVPNTHIWLHNSADGLAGRKWHPTREAAVLCAELMRTQRIWSLKKQIEKLEKLAF